MPAPRPHTHCDVHTFTLASCRCPIHRQAATGENQGREDARGHPSYLKSNSRGRNNAENDLCRAHDVHSREPRKRTPFLCWSRQPVRRIAGGLRPTRSPLRPPRPPRRLCAAIGGSAERASSRVQVGSHTHTHTHTRAHTHMHARARGCPRTNSRTPALRPVLTCVLSVLGT